MEPLWSLSASQARALYATGEVSPVEVTEATLARIDALNPIVNAFVALDRAGAMQAARASEARWRQHEPLGPLDGATLTVKDNLFVQGLPATWGSRLYADHVAGTDDTPVRRLREAGAVILGKTNTPELSLAGHTSNPLFGATRNPWNTELTPGGSSGGAAAAMLSGMGTLALATDAGGSIRRPAAHVGCIGLKPGNGRVPRRHGFPPLVHDLQVVGPLARTVEDAAALFACIADLSAPRAYGPLRIAAFCDVGGAPIEPAARNAWCKAMGLLDSLGHKVEEIAAPFETEEIDALFFGFAAAGVARAVTRIDGWRERVTDAIAKLAEQGMGIDAPSYVELLDRQRAFRWRIDELFAVADIVLTPTSPALAWPVADPYPQTIDGRPATPRGSAIHTTFVNMAGAAAISLPGEPSPEALPVGIQLVAPSGSEELLLTVAAAYRRPRRGRRWRRSEAAAPARGSGTCTIPPGLC